MVGPAANRTFLTLTYIAARNLLDKITANKVKRSTTKAGVLEVYKYAELEARCAQLEHLIKQIRQLVQANAITASASPLFCTTYGGEHIQN